MTKREFKTGDYGYGDYVSGRDCMIEVLTQRKAESYDFLCGLVDEFVNFILVTDREEELLDVLNETKKRREDLWEGGK